MHLYLVLAGAAVAVMRLMSERTAGMRALGSYSSCLATITFSKLESTSQDTHPGKIQSLTTACAAAVAQQSSSQQSKQVAVPHSSTPTPQSRAEPTAQSSSDNPVVRFHTNLFLSPLCTLPSSAPSSSSHFLKSSGTVSGVKNCCASCCLLAKCTRSACLPSSDLNSSQGPLNTQGASTSTMRCSLRVHTHRRTLWQVTATAHTH